MTQEQAALTAFVRQVEGLLCLCQAGKGGEIFSAEVNQRLINSLGLKRGDLVFISVRRNQR